MWEWLTHGFTLESIIEEFSKRYDIGQDVLSTSFNCMISELLDEGLVSPLEGDVDHGSGQPTVLPIEHLPQTFEPPVIQRYTDMQDLLLLDPIHEVEESGWPNMKSEA